MESNYRLTQYSHGAGCGCKIAPEVLDRILRQHAPPASFPGLLVGNESKDDAAVFDLDGQTAIVSTTDFFMPIVDDPFDFGAIAATNAISDIYAMGGRPVMAIAILGWPVDKLPPEVASEVLAGGRKVCEAAGIPLAGGHSIDAPEPIFGLAVTGVVPVHQVKRNTDARAGDVLYLTKPLGIGLVTTAQKRGLASDEDLALAKASMLRLNQIGELLASRPEVHGLTDVTGFGLAGHLLEICQGSRLQAKVQQEVLPVFPFVSKYLELGCVPGGTTRNWKSYGTHVTLEAGTDHRLLADPQTSGGLLITVGPKAQAEFESWMADQGYPVKPFGVMSDYEGAEWVRVG